MYHRNKQKRRMSWPMPQRAWANVENCNHLLPLSHLYFMYCLCTILPKDCWIGYCINIIFKWALDIDADWIFAMNLISSNLYTISLLETFPYITKNLIYDHLYFSHLNIFNEIIYLCIYLSDLFTSTSWLWLQIWMLVHTYRCP